MRRIAVICVLAVGIAGAALTLTHSLPGREAGQEAKGLAGGPSRGVVPLAGHRGAAAQRFDRAALDRVVRAYLARRPGEAGIMVNDLRTGRSYGHGERARFVTASVIKVDILAALLLRRQRAERGLNSGERALATEMIQVSDNNAADALYAEVGHGTGLTRANRVLGLTNTVPFGTVWGASRTSAADQVRLLRALIEPRSPLSAANRRYVLGLMGSVIGEQRWGISAAARPGERVALKNGWVPLDEHGDGWAINTMGRITGRHHDFLVAVCSESHPTMESGVATVEHLSDLVVSTLRRTR